MAVMAIDEEEVTSHHCKIRFFFPFLTQQFQQSFDRIIGNPSHSAYLSLQLEVLNKMEYVTLIMLRNNFSKSLNRMAFCIVTLSKLNMNFIYMSKDLIFINSGTAIFVYLSVFIPFVFPNKNVFAFLQLMETKAFGGLGLSHLSNCKLII